MKYYNIGESFKTLLRSYLNNLMRYSPTDDEIKLLNDIHELIKNRGIELWPHQ